MNKKLCYYIYQYLYTILCFYLGPRKLNQRKLIVISRIELKIVLKVSCVPCVGNYSQPKLLLGIKFNQHCLAIIANLKLWGMLFKNWELKI